MIYTEYSYTMRLEFKGGTINISRDLETPTSNREHAERQVLEAFERIKGNYAVKGAQIERLKIQ